MNIKKKKIEMLMLVYALCLSVVPVSKTVAAELREQTASQEFIDSKNETSNLDYVGTDQVSGAVCKAYGNYYFTKLVVKNNNTINSSTNMYYSYSDCVVVDVTTDSVYNKTDIKKLLDMLYDYSDSDLQPQYPYRKSSIIINVKSANKSRPAVIAGDIDKRNYSGNYQFLNYLQINVDGDALFSLNLKDVAADLISNGVVYGVPGNGTVFVKGDGFSNDYYGNRLYGNFIWTGKDKILCNNISFTDENEYVTIYPLEIAGYHPKSNSGMYNDGYNIIYGEPYDGRTKIITRTTDLSLNIENGHTKSYDLSNSFVPNEYNIILNYIDDGGEKSFNYKGAYDSEYTFLSVPSRTGYTFSGYTRDDGKTINTRSVIDILGDHTVQAEYRANKYRVTLDPDGGTVSTGSKLVTYDSIYGIFPEADKTGYSFEGWYLDDKKISSTDIVKVNSSHTLKAKYKALTVSVKLDPGEGECDVKDITVASGAEYGELPIPENKGYTFAGWYLDDEKIDKTTIVTEKFYLFHSYGKPLVAQWNDNTTNVSNKNETEEDKIKEYDKSIQIADIALEKEIELGSEEKTAKVSDTDTSKVITTEIKPVTSETYSVATETNTVLEESNPVKTENKQNELRLIPEIKKIKVKNISGKRLKISVYGQNVSGYQIQYSLSKDFSKVKTVNTIKQIYKTGKLKKKTYYIRARIYSNDWNNKKIYSNWSDVKRIKIKK